VKLGVDPSEQYNVSLHQKCPPGEMLIVLADLYSRSTWARDVVLTNHFMPRLSPLKQSESKSGQPVRQVAVAER